MRIINSAAITALGASLMITGYAGYRAPRGAQASVPERRPIAHSRPTTEAILPAEHRDGERARLKIDIVPDAAITQNGRDAIEYHAEATSDLKDDGAVAWSAFIVDDVGNVVQKLKTGVGAIKGRGMLATPAITVNLKDGYYSLRVRAAIHTAGWDDVAEEAQYLVVNNGRTREMDYDEWHLQSRDVYAIQDSSSRQLGGQP
jgi:hypothetical protein